MNFPIFCVYICVVLFHFCHGPLTKLENDPAHAATIINHMCDKKLPTLTLFAKERLPKTLLPADYASAMTDITTALAETAKKSRDDPAVLQGVEKFAKLFRTVTSEILVNAIGVKMAQIYSPLIVGGELQTNTIKDSLIGLKTQLLNIGYKKPGLLHVLERLTENADLMAEKSMTTFYVAVGKVIADIYRPNVSYELATSYTVNELDQIRAILTRDHIREADIQEIWTNANQAWTDMVSAVTVTETLATAVTGICQK